MYTDHDRTPAHERETDAAQYDSKMGLPWFGLHFDS